MASAIDIFDKFAQQYWEQHHELSNYSTFFDLLVGPLSVDSPILDIGCGPANMSQFIWNHYNKGSFYGIDGSKEMILLAQKHFPNGRFEQHDITSFNTSETFDAIICSFLLPYIDFQQGEQLLSRISHWILPGGRLFLATMIEEHPIQKESVNSQGDKLLMSYYSIERISNLMQKYNFKILVQETFPSNRDTDLILIAEKF